MTKIADPPAEPRRGSGAENEAYLARVGERVRLERIRRSLSRKLLSQASGVSERYLAELERGAANPSLLVLRQIGQALGLRVADIAAEDPDRGIDFTLLVHQLERLSPDELALARATLAGHLGRRGRDKRGRRIALIGLRGSGKTTLGVAAAEALGLTFIDLDGEIERVSGTGLSEIFAHHGHATYRRLERECLVSALHSHADMLIVAGGGIVTSTETFDLLLSSCFVVWVKASPAAHMARAGGHLRAPNPSAQAIAEFKAILTARAPLYAKADATIDTTDAGAEAAVRDLLALIGPAGEATSINDV